MSICIVGNTSPFSGDSKGSHFILQGELTLDRQNSRQEFVPPRIQAEVKVIERVEKCLAVALQCVKESHLSRNHLMIDGIFYFGFWCDQFQRDTECAREKLRGKFLAKDERRYPVSWGSTDIPWILEAIRGNGTYHPREDGLINSKDLVPQVELSPPEWSGVELFTQPLERHYRVDESSILAAIIYDFPITGFKPIDVHTAVTHYSDELLTAESFFLNYYLECFSVTDKDEIMSAIETLLNRVRTDPNLQEYLEKELDDPTTCFCAWIDTSVGLPNLHVEFSLDFPKDLLAEGTLNALNRNAKRLLPRLRFGAYQYLRLWATYTIENGLQCSARDSLDHWNNIVEHLASKGITSQRIATESLLWSVLGGAEVGSGETIYSRRKTVIKDRIAALQRVFGFTSSLPI